MKHSRDQLTWQLSVVAKDTEIRIGWQNARLKYFLGHCGGKRMFSILVIVLWVVNEVNIRLSINAAFFKGNFIPPSAIAANNHSKFDKQI